MSEMFGTPGVFAFAVSPLQGAPAEADASAARTWASLQLWVGGRNLTAHTHADEQLVHQGLHWPVVYLARWLVRSWPSFFERQVWPIPELNRNARDLAQELDYRIADNIDDDALLDMRDQFVRHHSLLAAAAGGLMPDVYLAHDGERVSVAWRAMNDTSSVRFHHSTGELDVPTTLFVDAAAGLVSWVAATLEPLRRVFINE